MNISTKMFIENCILPRVNVIEQRNSALNWPLNSEIPGYLQERAKELVTIYVMGMDTILIKLIAVFMEDILINIAIASRVNYADEYPAIQKKYEAKNGHEVLKELSDSNIICATDYEFCKRYYSNDGGLKIRNMEVHNKEQQKFSTKIIVAVDETTQQEKPVDEEVVSLLGQSPGLMRAINSNDVVNGIDGEIVGIINLLNNNAQLTSKLNNLKTKVTKEYFEAQRNQFKFKIAFPNSIDEPTINSLISKLPDMVSYTMEKQNSDTIVYVTFKSESCNVDLAMVFLPVIGNQFKILPAE